MWGRVVSGWSLSQREVRVGRAGLVSFLVVMLLAVPVPIGSAATASAEMLVASEVRSTFTSEFGLPRPKGVVLSATGDLLVLGDRSRRALRMTTAGDSQGEVPVDGVGAASSLVRDPGTGRLASLVGDRLVTTGRQGTTVASDESLDAARSVSIAPSGLVVALDSDGRSLHILGREKTTVAIDASVEDSAVIAVHPAEGIVYAISTDGDELSALELDGTVQKTFDMSALGFSSVESMTFAPSADPTDDPATMNLYVADSGTATELGRIAEVTLVQPTALTAPTEVATLVQRIDTWRWVPASPDPSGITYLEDLDRLQVADSEVEEVTGAGYHGVNLWQIDRQGTVTDTGTFYPAVSKEPTGLGSDSPDTLFVSDDSAGGIHIVRAGADSRFGTGDDNVTFIDAEAYGSTDAEDPEFHAASGHLFWVDGVGTEIYEVDPVDGIFGNGNDRVTHFDISAFGSDFEGLGSDPARGTLVVGARRTKKIFEITTSGELLRVIDLSGISGLTFISGLTTAPSSDGSGRTTYWVVDRAVDNNTTWSENDGKIFEVSVPTSDAPPTVAIDQPADGGVVAGAITVRATAGDDNGVASVRFQVNGTVIGTDTNGADGWTANWSTTAFADGLYTVTATATDSAGQIASDSHTVTVDNIDNPPTVSLGALPSSVGGSVALVASASDDDSVTSVSFAVDGVVIGTDTNGADGWTANWSTTAFADGLYTVTATATDSAGQTAGSAPLTVRVDNTAPTVAVTSPTAGATLSGVVTIAAAISDQSGGASVTFLVDGSAIGTDNDGANGWSLVWDSRTIGSGPHTISARATDSAGNVAASPAVQVTIENAAVLEAVIPVAAASDDAEEKSGKGFVTTSSDDLDMTLDKSTPIAAVGLRFTGVPVPRGAVITRASIRFTADERGSTAAALTVSVQSADNAPTFTTAKYGLSSRQTTGSGVQWVPVAWSSVGESAAAQTTPDLSALVQQIVSRPGWAQGNSIVFLITGTGAGTRVADSFEGGNPPVLDLEWSLP